MFLPSKVNVTLHKNNGTIEAIIMDENKNILDKMYIPEDSVFTENTIDPYREIALRFWRKYNINLIDRTEGCAPVIGDCIDEGLSEKQFDVIELQADLNTHALNIHAEIRAIVVEVLEDTGILKIN